jgi:hypothetical protein
LIEISHLSHAEHVKAKPTEDGLSFERMREIVRRAVAAPKADVDRAQLEYKRQKKRRRKSG